MTTVTPPPKKRARTKAVVKTLSPAAASGSTPSSANGWLTTPPSALRSAATVMPLLGGLVPGVTPAVLGPWTTRHAWHLYPTQVDPDAFGGRGRDEFIEALAAEGVPATPGYTALLSEQNGLKQLVADNPGAVRAEPCPVTESACRRSVWFFQNMLLADEHDMCDIAEAFAKVQKAFSR